MRSAARWACASTTCCSRRRSPANAAPAPSTSSHAGSSGHPMATSAPHARFVGVLPFAWRGGRRGALTVVDREARTLGPSTRTALANLASLIGARLEAEETGAFRPLGATGGPDADALGE